MCSLCKLSCAVLHDISEFELHTAEGAGFLGVENEMENSVENAVFEGLREGRNKHDRSV